MVAQFITNHLLMAIIPYFGGINCNSK